MRVFLIFLLCLPGFAIAAGGDDRGAPKPTQTTKECRGVKVWDDTKKRCVRPKQSSLGTDGLIKAARELAYAGRYNDAQGVLLALPDQNDDLALTYWGFTHRKIGNMELANAFYKQAIEENPNNILARSYMGQGFVEQGLSAQAFAQWQEIRARGGAGTWAGVSLRKAMETGDNFNY